MKKVLYKILCSLCYVCTLGKWCKGKGFKWCCKDKCEK